MTVTVSPAAATKPEPVSFCNVTVNVCGCTDLVRRIRRDRDLRRSPVLDGISTITRCASPVARVSETPPTATVVVARNVVVPAVADVIVTVQSPVAPTVAHVAEPTNEPGPLRMLTVHDVPAGAFTKPPEPAFTLT